MSSDSSKQEIILFRMGLASAGGLLLHLAFIIVSSAPLSRSCGDVFILIVSGASGLFLLIAAGLRKPPASFRWLILLACIAELGLRSVIWVQASRLPDFALTDTALYTDLAGELLRRGENPYTWDLTGAFDLYRTSQEASTPRLNGAKESRFPYPALLFLLVAPFQALNLPGAFLVSVVAHMAVLVLLFMASPRSVQPVILIPVVVGMDFGILTLIGTLDMVWAVLLAGMVVAWHKPTLRAILFGFATAVKQSPWLVTPFLIIRIWRDRNSNAPIRSVARFLAISGATFLAVNAPFIVWNPRAWFKGATEPLWDNLVFLSQGGLASLSHYGFAYLPKSYYSLAVLSILGLLLFCYWRHHDTLRHTFWIMPGIFMWCSYRSLVSYWTYWTFPVLATLITQTSPGKESAEKPAWRPTVVITAAVLGILLATGIFLSSSPVAAQVRLLYPLFTTGGQITRMDVEVVNRSRHILTPRFAIQDRYTTGNPLPWTIEQGPLSLSPGQAGIYHISANQHDRRFWVHDTAQLVVTDAGGNYSLRGIATIGLDRSFLWPDAIPNPAYLFWDKAPIFWGLATDPQGSGTVWLENKDGRGALKLVLNANSEGLNRVALQTQIPFPLNPFGIWVYSDPPLDNPSSVAYGLEIDDGQHRLWFLFGPQDYAGPLEEDQYIINRNVPSQKWVYQEIDVMAAYAEAGWQLPALRPAIYRDLEVDFRLVTLRLLLATDSPRGTLEAHFGPIKNSNVEPKTLMAETLDNPASYYTRLAESYIRSRNYSRALEAYQRALHFSPGAPQALKGVDWIMQYLAEENSK